MNWDMTFALPSSGARSWPMAAERAFIQLDRIEPSLAIPLSKDALTESLARHADALAVGARETLRIASLNVACVEKVIYVGGASLMSPVSQTMKNQFPQAVHSFSEVLTAVANELAIAAGDARPIRPA